MNRKLFDRFIISLFIFSILAAMGRLLLMAGGDDGSFTLSGQKGIYVLEIYEPIMYLSQGQGIFSGYSGVKKWVEEIKIAKNSPNITGLLIHFNSPGGSVGATQELFEAVKDFKASGKKVVVSVIDLCASGAYYAALPADKIFANSGAYLGSIGVIISSMEFTGFMKKFGIKDNTIASGKFKASLSPTRKMNEETKKLFQKHVDDIHDIFLNEVITWRSEKNEKPANEKKIKKIADGRVVTAAGAVDAGLIDEIGSLEDAIKALALACGLNPENVKRYRAQEEMFPLRFNIGGASFRMPFEATLPEFRFRGFTE